MKHTETFIKNSNNQKLYTQSWLPESEMAALVVLSHGYAEHSGRYRHAAERFVREGVGVFALDHRGFGKSEGRRADVGDFDDYVDDLELFFDSVIKNYLEKPRFVLGHSMGGTIAIKLVIKNPKLVSGMLVTGALVKINDNISPFLQKIANIIAALLPLLPIEALDASAISRDPEVVARYDSDPLVYRGRVRARMGAQMLRACREICASLQEIAIPFWAGHGTADKLADPLGSQWLYKRASSKDKTLRLFDGLYHEILNEPEKMAILDEMIAWMKARSYTS